MNYAYLSNGSLHIAKDGGAFKEYESEFGMQVLRRQQNMEERHAWKSQEAGMGYNLWNRGGGEGAAGILPSEVRIVSACDAGEKGLFFVLSTPSVGGLFRYHKQEDRELRIFHKEGLYLTDLHHHAGREEFLCAVPDQEGQHLGILRDSGADLELLTEGDSVDAHPYWVPGTENQLLYQSAGIGRYRDGSFSHLGPSGILRLNLETASTEELFSDPAYDYLNPSEDGEGNLYCIRRPYFQGGFRSHREALKDFLLIPYRLLRGLYGFLNAFTQLFGKRTLTNAATGEKKEVENHQMFLKGARLQQAAEGAAGEDAILVPNTWELICRKPSGEVEVIEKNVGEYCLLPEGGILFSDGRRIREWNEGESKLLFKTKNVIEQLLVY